MIKTTVGEFRQFYDSDTLTKLCEDGHGWVEDIAYYVDGASDPAEEDETIIMADIPGALDPATALKIEGGAVVYPLGASKDEIDIERLFRRWRRERDYVILLVEVPRDKVEAISTALTAAGAKIHKP